MDYVLYFRFNIAKVNFMYDFLVALAIFRTNA